MGTLDADDNLDNDNDNDDCKRHQMEKDMISH